MPPKAPSTLLFFIGVFSFNGQKRKELTRNYDGSFKYTSCTYLKLKQFYTLLAYLFLK